jgi:elongation factor G
VKSYPTDRVRNILIVGHGGAGKTSLVEAVLHSTGATNRIGRVEDGTTVTDFEPEETRKQISVSLAVAPVEYDGFKVNLLDAPGYADFIGDVRSALPAADAVLFVISAVEGVETQTEVVWTMAEELGLPRAFFINKLDRDRASFSRCLDGIQAAFGKACPPLYLPIGEEQDFRGLVGLLSGRAYTYDGAKRTEGDVPDDLTDAAASLREQLIEAIIQESEDEDLMDRYLGGEEIAPTDLIGDLEQAVAAGRLFPVLAGAAIRNVGVTELLEVCTQAFPSPAERPEVEGRRADPDGPLAAYVFKTIADPYVGRMNLFRVVSGTFRPDTTVFNATKRKDERVGHLLTVRGKAQEPADQVVAGDIGAVAKLADTSTGDTLTAKDAPVVLPSPVMPDPLLPIAIAPKSRGDEEKLSSGLARAEAEDLTLRVERNAETHQTVLWGMGENHIEVTLERLKRKYGVEVTQVPLLLPYKETFKAPVKAMGRHVKQSGGHGQYAICNIEVEPLPRSSGFEFVDKIFGGSIPNQYIPSVEKGVVKAMSQGVMSGNPMVDIRCTLLDGKFHPVDSSDMAFQIAGSLALREAAEAAGVALLEPIAELEVLVPETMTGDVMGDLNSKRAKIGGVESASGGKQRVKAMVPQAEVARYAIDLRSITGGRGAFTMRFSHYEEMPSHLADKIVAEAQKAREEAQKR